MVIQQDDVDTGTHAARGMASSGQTAYAYKQLTTTYPDLYYQVRFKVVSQSSSSSTYIVRHRTSGGTSLLGVFINKTGELSYRNDRSGVTTRSTTNVTKGVWHTVQVRVSVAGANGATEVWYDGTKVNDLSKTEDFGTVGTGRIQLGESSTDRIFTHVFDNVQVATSFIP